MYPHNQPRVDTPASLRNTDSDEIRHPLPSGRRWRMVTAVLQKTAVGVLACTLLSSGYAAAPELEDFWSDGCTLFPDGTFNNRSLWCDCCFNHDIAYWRGGTEEERKQADKALDACVLARTGNRALADTMYNGVRVGGSPAFPTWYRWGYGWKYGRGYQALSEEERKAADQALARYYKKHAHGYCRTRP